MIDIHQLALAGEDYSKLSPGHVPHEELIEAAIEAGKHVMMEKVFVLQLTPAWRLTEMAEARGLKIVVT